MGKHIQDTGSQIHLDSPLTSETLSASTAIISSGTLTVVGVGATNLGGDLSVTGNITGANLTGNNTGDQDLSAYATSSDIVATSGAIVNLRTFTGSTSGTDISPTYSSTTYINNGDSLETAIGKLDAQIVVGGGVSDPLIINDVMAQNSVSATTSITSSGTISATGNITGANLFGSNTGDQDLGVYALSSDVVAASGAITNLRTFTGATSGTDTSPTYSSTTYINNGDSLELAIGTLDNCLTIVSGLVGGASTFLDLTDTPANYTAAGGKYLAVNAGADAIEFVDAPSGGGGISSTDPHFQTTTVSGLSTLGIEEITGSGLAVKSHGVIEITLPGSGLILTDSTSKRWGLYVDTDGVLVTTEA